MGSDFTSLINTVESSNRSTFEKAIKIIFELKGSWEGEIKFVGQDKQIFFAMVSLGYFAISKDALIFVKITDISALKIAEQKLRESLAETEANNIRLGNSKTALVNVINDVVSERLEVQLRQQKLNAILESITEGVVVIDFGRKIFLYNNSTLRMLGYLQEDFANKEAVKVLRFVDEKTGNLVEEFISKAFEGQVVSKFNNIGLLTNENVILPTILTASPIFDDNKGVNKVVIVFSDATEQRKVDKMRQEFVSVVSHQLRTPLTGIKWFIELLNDESTNQNLKAEQKTAIKSIFESNERMIKLVNDLLNVSRIETGKNLNIKLEESDFVLLIREVMSELEILAV